MPQRFNETLYAKSVTNLAHKDSSRHFDAASSAVNPADAATVCKIHKAVN